MWDRINIDPPLTLKGIPVALDPSLPTTFAEARAALITAHELLEEQRNVPADERGEQGSAEHELSHEAEIYVQLCWHYRANDFADCSRQELAELLLQAKAVDKAVRLEKPYDRRKAQDAVLEVSAIKLAQERLKQGGKRTLRP